MARKGNQNRKKSYMKYKAEGHLEINKKKKQERHEKRMNKFAEKRTLGNGYVYSKERTANETPDKKSKLNGNLKTEFAKYRSLFAKLDNELKDKKEKEKMNLKKQSSNIKLNQESDEEIYEERRKKN